MDRSGKRIKSKVNPKLSKPFTGDYPISFAFGEKPTSELLKKRFQKFRLKGHNGIDYEMPVGIEILATDDGKVVKSGNYKSDYGVLVKIKHSWGESLYAHLKMVKVRVGLKVKRGQIIGYSGDTGFCTKPHLHFAIRVNPFYTGDGYEGWSNPEQYFVVKSNKDEN